MIMYIRQNFAGILHRLGNRELRKTIASRIKMMRKLIFIIQMMAQMTHDTDDED